MSGWIQVFFEFFVFLINCNWFALTDALNCDQKGKTRREKQHSLCAAFLV